MIVPQFVEVDLIAYKGKSLAKGHDKVLHIVYYALLYHTFVNILVMHTEFLHIDKVEQILILKHADGPISLLVVRDGSEKLLGMLP